MVGYAEELLGTKRDKPRSYSDELLSPPTSQPAPPPIPEPVRPPTRAGMQGGEFVEGFQRGFMGSSREIAQGSSFNFSDELAAGVTAGVNALMGIDDSYEQALAREQARLAEFRQAQPVAALAGQGVGGVMVGVPAAARVLGTRAASLGTMAGIPGVTRVLGTGAVSTGQATLRGAGVGAAAGGLAGAGAAEPGRRTEGALIGGAAGLGIGAAFPLAKDSVTALIRRFVGSRPDAATRRSATKILQALQRDELTPDEAFARVQRLGPEGTLADVGENTRDLARAVAGQPGPGKRIALDVLESRQEEQGTRLVRAVNRALDPTGDFAGAVDDLQAARLSAARPLYDKAYSQQIEPSDDLVALFRRPAMKTAWRKARVTAENEGEILPELFIRRPDGGEVLNTDAIRDVKVLDYLKDALDEVVEKNRNQITGRIMGRGPKAVDSLRKDLLAAVDALSPDYKAARAAWSGPSRSLEVMEQGRRFARGDEEVTRRVLERMTDDERFFFRMGAARATRDMIHNTPDGADAVKRIFGSDLKRQRLRAVFPDDETFNAFRETMESEAEMFTTRARASPRAGSPTELRQAGTADLLADVGEGARALARGDTGTASMRFLRSLFGRSAERLSPEQSESLARALFTNDPNVNREIVRAFSIARFSGQLTLPTVAAGTEASRQFGTAFAP